MADGHQIEISRVDPTTNCIHLLGTWRLENGLPEDAELVRDIQDAWTGQRISFDTAALLGWDSSLVTFLAALIDECRRRSVEVDRANLPEGVRRLLELAEAVPEAAMPEAAAGPERSWALRVGRATEAAWGSVVRALMFLGEVTLAFGRLVSGRAKRRRSDLFHELQAAGASALPIVTLISVLIGMILAFVGGVTLRDFGATIYVADLVAIATVRELAAIMTAIVMAGRTGSAYAAELGSMRVSQEVDALVTMGISPIDFMVLNRVAALSLMMPLLCVYADFLGILGGSIVATRVLGVSFSQYFHEVKQSITLTTFTIGIAKSVVFGVLVAVCGCLAGFRAGRSAAAVGEAATRAVVSAIVWVIVIDGLFAIVFYVLGV